MNCFIIKNKYDIFPNKNSIHNTKVKTINMENLLFYQIKLLSY